MVGTTTRANRKTTASKPLLATSKTIEEHAPGIGICTAINNPATARKLLNTHGLMFLVTGKALRDISAALFKLSLVTNLGATHSEIIRALAFIVFEAYQSSDIEKVIDKIEVLMKGPLATLDMNVDKLEDLTSTCYNTLHESPCHSCPLPPARL
ncbi:hypothetical protein EV424DRAFT_1349890 [Suillus variegatus]|nr:hypothetical protein EV424DRAFT_1349890 [Suillus variegatus]